MSPLIQGIIRVPPDISDHCATYVNLPFEYPVHGSFIEMSDCIKMQIMNCLINKSPILTGRVFIRVVLTELANYSQIFSLNLQNWPCPVKQLQLEKMINHGMILQ